MLITKTGKRYFVFCAKEFGHVFCTSEYIRKEWGTKIIVKKDEARGSGQEAGSFGHGANEAQAQANLQRRSRYCGHCGGAIEDSYGFCPACGRRNE